MTNIRDPILNRFVTVLRSSYGDRIERLILFGSRARGDERPDSDYDVAVFLKDPFAFGEESGVIALIETDILYDTGVIINSLPLLATSYEQDTSFMKELRRDGIDLRRLQRCTTSAEPERLCWKQSKSPP